MHKAEDGLGGPVGLSGHVVDGVGGGEAQGGGGDGTDEDDGGEADEGDEVDEEAAA